MLVFFKLNEFLGLLGWQFLSSPCLVQLDGYFLDCVGVFLEVTLSSGTLGCFTKDTIVYLGQSEV